MSNTFDSIKQGLIEAIDHVQGKRVAVKTYTPHQVDVAEVRRRIGMTQQQFASRFGFSVSTLRHWERGDRTPRGPALVLLNVIERNPTAVIQALG